MDCTATTTVKLQVNFGLGGCLEAASRILRLVRCQINSGFCMFRANAGKEINLGKQT